ncbi:MAG: glycosyltransferase family 2 protein [Ignavibacteria bacterium]|nr:glycosyltransferase family 2 protein [Ignavibacteria bacterium]
MQHSFVIPAYGESVYLEACIESILSQSVKSEIMITTSTPNEFIEHTAGKYGIRLIVNAGPTSIAGDWNFAFKSASTKYVTLAHQDDYYEREYAEYNLESAERNDDMLIQFSDYSEKIMESVVVNSMKVRIKKMLLLFFLLKKNGYKSGFIKKFMLSFGCPICCPSVFFNKDGLNGFEFNNEYRINLDWNAWIRMSKMKGRFIYINKKLLTLRIHGDSETSMNLQHRKSEDIKVFDELWYYPFSRLLSFVYSLSYSSFK